MASQAPPSAIGAHVANRGVAARSALDEPRIRRSLQPGDIGAIAALHGRIYLPEHDLDVTFEADLGRSLYAAAERGWPAKDEGVWIVERSGAMAGSLVLTDEGAGTGQVRAFLLDPSLRGRGLGSRLLDELLSKARAVGYDRLVLTTFSELRTAARLYRSRGFELASEEIAPRWGMERMTYQRYALDPLRGVPTRDAPRPG